MFVWIKKPPSDENILILSFGGLNNLIDQVPIYYFFWLTNQY